MSTDDMELLFAIDALASDSEGSSPSPEQIYFSPTPDFPDPVLTAVSLKRQRSSLSVASPSEESDHTDEDIEDDFQDEYVETGNLEVDDEEYMPLNTTKMAKRNRGGTPLGVSKKRKTGSGRMRGRRELTSSYRGVCWYKRTQRWVAQIKVKGVRKHIGYFRNELDAKNAYDAAMEKIAQNPDRDLNELV